MEKTSLWCKNHPVAEDIFLRLPQTSLTRNPVQVYCLSDNCSGLFQRRYLPLPGPNHCRLQRETFPLQPPYIHDYLYDIRLRRSDSASFGRCHSWRKGPKHDGCWSCNHQNWTGSTPGCHCHLCYASSRIWFPGIPAPRPMGLQVFCLTQVPGIFALPHWYLFQLSICSSNLFF